MTLWRAGVQSPGDDDHDNDDDDSDNDDHDNDDNDVYRCTFSTDKSLASQEMADAVLFHMPNFHWDK